LLKVTIAAGATVLLAGCATQPVPPGTTLDEPPATASTALGAEAAKTAPPQKPAYVLKRGGAYYQDDGPGDNPPDNLESVPEPEPKAEPLHRFANNAYAVFGREYVPHLELKPYKAQGIASWYGRKFHGLRTSSGEPYDMYGVSAAHPTLPIPSYARVTNLQNGKSVVVRVNDRGPFHRERLIDLSYTAAHKLGFADRGSARVEVQSILPSGPSIAAAPPRRPKREPAPQVAMAPEAGKSASPTPEVPDARDPIAQLAARTEVTTPMTAIPASNSAMGVFVQVGAFSSRNNAESFKAHLIRQLAWVTDKLILQSNGGIFRLQLGPYLSAHEANRVAERITEIFGQRPILIR